MKDVNLDDKDLVIISVLILGILCIFAPGQEDTVGSIITGLFGLAVGRKTT